MFTGIVQACVPIVALERKPGLTTLTLELPEAYARNITRGASISVDGICLTVTTIDGARVRFDAMVETLDRTTLGQRELGDRVNIERAARIGDEIGGHLMSGHIHGTATVVAEDLQENNRALTFEVPEALMEYIFDKGYIALDGCSLTICDVDRAQRRFRVFFIPETLAVTTFGHRAIGDAVNVEIDSQTQTIVETVKAVLARQNQG